MSGCNSYSHHSWLFRVSWSESLSHCWRSLLELRSSSHRAASSSSRRAPDAPSSCCQVRFAPWSNLAASVVAPEPSAASVSGSAPCSSFCGVQVWVGQPLPEVYGSSFPVSPASSGPQKYFWTCWNIRQVLCLKFPSKGRSPGLVVMGGDSRSEGCGFESQCRILDGHFFTLICCKIVLFVWKRPKINENEAGMAHFLKVSIFKVKLLRLSIDLMFGVISQWTSAPFD